MRKIYILAAFAFAALVSCNKEIAPVENIPAIPDGFVPVTLTAQNDAATKAQLSDKSIIWKVGESVAVFANGAGSPIEFTVTEIEGDETMESVHFSGAVPEGTSIFIAAYPFDSALTCTSGVVTMNIPATQTIPADAVVDPVAMPSLAYFPDAETKSKFYNTMSLLKFNVGETENVEEIRIAFTGDQKPAGTIKVQAVEGAAPIVSNEATESIVVKADGGFVPGKDYFAAVAPLSAQGLHVELVSGGKTGIRESANAITLERNKGKNLGDLTADAKWKLSGIRNVEDLQAFLEAADSYAEGETVEVLEDIDCSGAQIPIAKSFAGTLEGNGHTLKNLTISNAIIASLGETGVVQNLNVDSNSSIEWYDPIPDQTAIAFIVSKSKGKVLNCSVAGSINVGSDDAGRIYCAGVVGLSTTGYVEACKFSGSIEVELYSTSKSCSAISGVVARAGDVKMAGTVIVKDCENDGSIKFVFSGPAKAMQKFGIGGVLGQTPSLANNDYTTPERTFNHGIVEGCTNRGKLEWQYPAGGSGSYPAFGGVAGIIEGQINKCNNYGKLTYTGSLDVAVTDASIGGVAGYVTDNATDCHNYGSFNINSAFAGGTSLAQSGGNTTYSTFGGVFGNVGPYAKDETYSASKGVEIRNCTNEANIKFNCYMVASGGPKMCFGGVVGASTANMKNCHNNKALTINTQTKYIYSGGVVGFIEADMDNCSNKGIITVDGCADESTINYTQAYIGGVFGTVTKGSTLSNLKNSGSVTVSNVVSTDSALSYVGGVGSYYIGSFKLENSSNTATVNSNADTPVCLGGVMGAFNGTMTNCKNSGKVMYSSTYISPYEKDGGDKKPEIGGLVGYANADFIGCSNTGTVTSVADDGYLSGFVAGFGNASKTWANCTVNCSVESSATNASVLGRFRNIASNQTITLGAEDQPFTIEGPTAELPKFGQDCGTGNQVVMFE